MIKQPAWIEDEIDHSDGDEDSRMLTGSKARRPSTTSLSSLDMGGLGLADESDESVVSIHEEIDSEEEFRQHSASGSVKHARTSSRANVAQNRPQRSSGPGSNKVLRSAVSHKYHLLICRRHLTDYFPAAQPCNLGSIHAALNMGRSATSRGETKCSSRLLILHTFVFPAAEVERA